MPCGRSIRMCLRRSPSLPPRRSHSILPSMWQMAKVHTEFVTVESEHIFHVCLHRRGGGRRPGGHVPLLPADWHLCMSFCMWRLPAACPSLLACVQPALCPAPSTSTTTIPIPWAPRDAGWIQIYAENNQEAYDNYRAGHAGLPSAGRASADDDLSWTVLSPPMRWKILNCWKRMREVKGFVGEYQPENYLLKA